MINLSKPRVCLFYSTFLFLVVLLLNLSCTGAQEFIAPSAGNDAASDEADTGLCQSDDSLADMCRACAALPSMISLPEEECCGDLDAMLVCKDCLSDPVSCLKDVVAIENMLFASQIPDQVEGGQLDVTDALAANEFGSPEEFYSDDNVAAAAPEVDKRFGTLYLGKRPLRFSLPKTVQSDVIKRDDTGSTGSFDNDINDVDKRWGTLGLGSRSYGRHARMTPVNRMLTRYRNNGKRWGTLGIGKRWGSLGIGNGKRWGTLGIGNGKRWGSLGIGNRNRWSSTGKRWGTLGLSKRWGSLGIGNWKRWGSLGLAPRYRTGNDKRWGTLGIGKRMTTNENEPLDEEKRWGSLGLSSWRKRWGQLGLGRGRGKRWGTLGIGKRKEVLTALDDDNANYLDSMSEDRDDEKRWGTLSIGKRGDAISTEESATI